MLTAATGGVPVDWDSAGGADLPSMGVAAEVEVITVSGRLSVGLRRVGEKDGDFTFGNPGTCRSQIVCPEEVRVIDPADPDPLPLLLDGP